MFLSYFTNLVPTSQFLSFEKEETLLVVTGKGRCEHIIIDTAFRGMYLPPSFPDPRLQSAKIVGQGTMTDSDSDESQR